MVSEQDLERIRKKVGITKSEHYESSMKYFRIAMVAALVSSQLAFCSVPCTSPVLVSLYFSF